MPRKKMESNVPSNVMLSRLMFVTVCFSLVGFFVIGIKLFNMQVIDYSFYQEKAVNNQTRDRIVAPKRGSIYDRNMKELAVSASTEMVIVNPKKVKEGTHEELATGLSKILDTDYETILKKLRKNSSYEFIKRGVERDKADEVRSFIKDGSYKGISLSEDTKRYYPYGSFASHIIGFIGTDGYGLAGIEAMYNDTLSGTSGRVITAETAIGTEMPFSYEEYIPPKNGKHLVLTVDEVIQHFLEKNLEIVLSETQANSGVAGIVMDVKTGEVLAMATKPDFDLNDPFTITDPEMLKLLEPLEGETEPQMSKTDLLSKIWRNKIVQDTYEPGSTFKNFTLAVAIEEGLVDISSTFVCTGIKHVGGWPIRCWKAGGHGTQTLLQTLQNSCNPAMMEMGARIGQEIFVKYYEGFGFKAKTGIDLPGEATGLFHKSDSFDDTSLAVSSFGQSFQITPLQLISAISAIVNDGKLMKPYIVKEMLDIDGTVVETYKPQQIRQVISQSTSDIMKDALESVVTIGTAKRGYITGYRAGGKTATSEKIPRGNGKYIASYVGLAPMDDPQIAVLVMIDEPQGYLHQGGQIAAPVVRRILEETLIYSGVEKHYTEDEIAMRDISVPSLIGLSREQVGQALSGKSLSYKFVGDGDVVTDQIPSNGAKIPSTAEVIVYMGEKRPTEAVKVPNVYGMTQNQAAAALKSAGLYMKITGLSSQTLSKNAVAAKQQPVVGTEVSLGTVITVEFADNTNVGE